MLPILCQQPYRQSTTVSLNKMNSSPLRKKRSVSFDEELNEVREFDRVPPEDKGNLWLSKIQIRKNRLEAQEELMMEKTRQLVKAKLVEEATLPTDQIELVRQVQMLQQQLEEIMRRPKHEILAFLQTKFNWITDCTDYWADLPENIRQAASKLGYTQQLWDEFNQQLEVFDKPWNALTVEQQDAAQIIGYNEVTWNASLKSYSPLSPFPYDDPKKTALVEMEEGENTSTKDVIENSGTDQDDPQPNNIENMEESSSSSEDGEDLTDATTDDNENSIISEYNWVQNDESPLDSNDDDMIDDEAEFISNFLLDDTNKPTSSETNTRSLQDRYVPSDDEFELDLEEAKETVDETEKSEEKDLVKQVEGDGRAKEKTVEVDTRNLVQEKATTIASSTYRKDQRMTNEESAPLLGHKAPSVREKGLVRRIWGSSSDPRGESSCTSDVEQGDDDNNDDDDDAESHYKPNHFAFSKTQKRIGLALLGLAVFWLVKSHKARSR